MFRKSASYSFGSKKKPQLKSAKRHSSNSSPSSPSVSASASEQQRFEKSEQGGSAECNFRYGAVAVQGFRPHMQDDFACSPSLTLNTEPLGFFAVFDGHGNHGDVVSQYCADNFLSSLLERKGLRNYHRGRSKSKSGGSGSGGGGGDGGVARSNSHGGFKGHGSNNDGDVISSALRKTFLKFDQQLRDAVQNQRDTPSEERVSFVFSGTTATTALLSRDAVFVANTGDSRTLLCRGGDLHFATVDHNPGDPLEDARIEAAGGKIHTTPSKHKIIMDVEAYTNLAVSRTLGDFGFKTSHKLPAEEQVVSPAPDVSVFEREHQRDEFLLLASDGVFKSLSNSEVIEFVLRQLALTDDLPMICRNLIDMAYYSPSCYPDDTTVILVTFPAAPTPDAKTISEEEIMQVECKEAICREIEKLASEAEGKWVLKNDFNIIQKLAGSLPKKYCLQLHHEFIRQRISDVKQDRFGVEDLQPKSKEEAESYENKEGDGGGDEDVYIPESSPPQADCVVTSTIGGEDTDLDNIANNKQQQQEQQQQQDAEISNTDNSVVASSSLEKQDDEVDTSSEMASLSSPVQQQQQEQSSSPTQSGGIIM